MMVSLRPRFPWLLERHLANLLVRLHLAPRAFAIRRAGRAAQAQNSLPSGSAKVTQVCGP